MQQKFKIISKKKFKIKQIFFKKNAKNAKIKTIYWVIYYTLNIN